MEPELAKIVGIAVAVLIAVIVLFLLLLLAARRRLDRSWRATQEQRAILFDRLKQQGLLVQQFIDTASHRLAGERDGLETLRRRQTEVSAGRTPAEKAAATVALNGLLDRLIAAADNDPGLSGLTEYETVREKMEQAVSAIGRAATGYNAAADTYNRQAAGFFGRLFGSLQTERFDANKKKSGRRP